MINLKNEIKSVRDRLINYSLLALLVLATPIFVVSLIYSFKVSNSFSIHFLEFGFIALIFAFRHKINSFLKANIVASLYVLAGIMGVYFFGISGGYFLSVIGIALITLFYGKRLGIIYSIIATLSFVIIQSLYFEGYIVRQIDYNEFNESLNNWIAAFFTLVITSFILIFSISIFYDYLSLLFTNLDTNNNQLNNLNLAYQKVLQQIEDSETKYKKIFQSLSEAVIVSDEEGNVIDCNDAAIKLFGFNREFFLSINLHTTDFKYFYPDLTPMPKRECPGKKSLDTGLPYRNIEIGFQTNEGIKWIIINSELFNIKGYGVYLTLHDITEFVEEKNNLQNKTNMINLLLNSTAEGIYGMDLDGNCTFVNHACLKMLGYNTEEEFLGKNTHYLIHHSHKDGSNMPIEECKVRLATDKGIEVNCDDDVFWKKDNTSIAVDYYSHPQIIDGKIVGGVVTFLDVTNRKESEKKLKSYNAELKRLNTDKDNFIRILAHDLKNPLNSIMGFSDFILNNYDDINDQTIKEYCSIINESSIKTFELMEEILLWLKVQSGKLKANPTQLEPYQIFESITKTFMPVAQNKLITIENKIPSDLIINADINMTKTIIRNLISNAIKYNKVGGKIIINSEKRENETIIYIEDYGIGMSEKEVEDAFLPHNSQSKEGTMGEKGTGFGLLICNELVLKQNGKIWIESQEGKGSKFIFSLPN